MYGAGLQPKRQKQIQHKVLDLSLWRMSSNSECDFCCVLSMPRLHKTLSKPPSAFAHQYLPARYAWRKYSMKSEMKLSFKRTFKSQNIANMHKSSFGQISLPENPIWYVTLAVKRSWSMHIQFLMLFAYFMADWLIEAGPTWRISLFSSIPTLRAVPWWFISLSSSTFR